MFYCFILFLYYQGFFFFFINLTLSISINYIPMEVWKNFNLVFMRNKNFICVFFHLFNTKIFDFKVFVLNLIFLVHLKEIFIFLFFSNFLLLIDLNHFIFMNIISFYLYLWINFPKSKLFYDFLVFLFWLRDIILIIGKIYSSN